MTENQRLRELLKEARDLYGCYGQCPPACVWSRIDAALAEPAEVHPSSLTDVVTLLENERDEARAEIELLRKRLGEKSVVKTEELNAAWTEGTLVAGDVLRPKIADAFKRGAEAMREQAASLFDGGQNVPGLMRSPEFRDFIRTLPLPKENP